MATDIRRTPTVQRRRSTGARSVRRPKHNYNVLFRPFEIQPFCIAPVAAGDSVKSLRFEARVLTDPIVNQITGWWAEQYWFYVPISVLDEYEAAQANVITPAHDLSGLVTDAGTGNYETSNGPSWLSMCMKPIIRHYFRKEGEDWNTSGRTMATYGSGSMPIAGLVGKTWVDSVVRTSTLSLTGGGTDYEDRWEIYEQLRKQKLINMTFREYLMREGVITPQQLLEAESDYRKPELWRFVRQFTYPSNVVNPQETNEVVSACSWVLSERLDKSYFCQEPGFVVGVAVVRPKLYRGEQLANGTMMLRDARTWLPNMFEDSPQESLDERTTNTALDTTEAHIVDVASLYTMGDQFLRTASGRLPPTSALPNSTVDNVGYPVIGDVLPLFAGYVAQAATDIFGLVAMDGTASFQITGRKHSSVTLA